MKKFLQKSSAWLVMLVAMFAVSMSAMAQDVTFNLRNQSVKTLTSDEVTITFNNYSQGANIYNNWDSYSLKIESEKNIVRVEFEGSDATYEATPVVEKNDVGSFDFQAYGTSVWTGSSKTVHFIGVSGTDFYVTDLRVWLEETGPAGPVTYTVNFTGEVPAGCSASYGDDTFTSNDSFEVAKNLKKEDLNITTTADYYADVDYNEGSHTYTVAFYHWITYNVTVTGHPMGALEYNGYYGDGNSFQSKTVVDEAALSAYDLNGYDEAVSVTQESEYVYNVAVTYTESALITYHVVFNTVPEGAYAWINNVKYEANADFQTNLELSNSSIQDVHCPEGYYDNSYYNADDQTFYINFIEYDKYYVVVEGTEDANAGVKYNFETYHNGDVIYTTFPLYDYYVTPVDVAGYNVEVTLDDHTFTVTYTEKPVPTAPWSITFDADGQAQCQTVDKNGYNTWNASSDYDYSTYQYVPCFKYNYTDYAAANDFIILPAVKLEAGKSYTVSVNTRCESSSWAERMEVVYGTVADVEEFNYTAIPNTTVNWTYRKDLSGDISVDADGKYYFAIHATSDAGRYYLYAYSFSIEEAAGPAPRENTVDLMTDFANGPKPWLSSATNPVLGEVSSLYNISIELDTNCEVAHWAGDGGNECPDGVTFKDANGNSYTISEFSYWANDTQVGVKLENEITTPGVYTLTIPAGVVPCVDNKANKELVLTWTVLAPAPEFPKQGVDYKIALYNSVAYPDGGYLNVVTDNGNNGTVRRDTPEALNFTWDGAEGAFTIQDKDGNYIGGATGNNTWNCNYDVVEYWTVNEVSEGVYTFTSKTGGNEKLLGFNTDSGNAFRNCTSNQDVYFTIEEILYPVATFNMSAAGWATLCISQAFTVPEGYKAYTVGKLEVGVPTLAEGDQIVLTEVYDVPAETAVLLEGPAATDIELYAPEYTPAHTQVNFLWGNGNAVAVTYYAANMADYGHGTYYPMEDEWENGTFGPCQLYQLANENDKVGFYRQFEDGSTLTCGAHKAFLVVPTAVAASNARLLFPGQTITGINTVATEGVEKVYNLQGQRVNTAKNGVFVKNGKKFIVK